MSADPRGAKTPGKGTPAPGDGEVAEAGKRGGKLSAILGWVVLPGSVALLIFGAGAYFGVHQPDSWVTRFVRWIAG